MTYGAFRSLAMSLALCSMGVNAGSGEAYGIFLSKDGGVSWIRSDGGLQKDARINALAKLGVATVAGTDAGIFVSADDAKSWAAAGERVRVTSLVASKNHLWAGTAEGLFLVSRDAQNWETNQSFPRRWVRSLHVAKEAIYAGTDADFVYRSADEGKTWTQMATGLPADAQVFALTSIDGQVFAGLYAKGLYSWNQNEQKWTQVGAAQGIKPLALAASENALIAGHNPGGNFWSLDRGESWERWALLEDAARVATLDSILSGGAESTNIAATAVMDAPIWEIAADPKIAIVGAGAGIYFSNDRGRTWSRATKGLPANGPGIAFHISDGVIFAAVQLKDGSCERFGPNNDEVSAIKQ
jgi:photosystem II stability/assembly factor-like uncharacterized protein